jgi:importin subunit alpha-1
MDFFQTLKQQPCRQVSVVAAKSLRTLTTNSALKLVTHAKDIRGVVSALSQLLFSSGTGSECLLSVCAALNNLVEEEEKETIAEVFRCPEIPRRLVELVAQGVVAQDIQFYAVDALGHLAAGSEQEMKTLLDMNILPAMRGAVFNKTLHISSAACRCVSNITAGSAEMIQAVIEANLFPVFINLMQHSSADQNVRMYSAYAIMFSFHGANLRQTMYLVNSGSIPPIVNLLREGEVEKSRELTVEALTALEMILFKFEFESDFDHVVAIVQSAGGWDSVTRLRSSLDAEIQKLAASLDVDVLRTNFMTSNVVAASDLYAVDQMVQSVAAKDVSVGEGDGVASAQNIE